MTSFVFTRIIDPLTKGLRHLTAEQCGAGNTIIDLGCGPGTLAFELAKNNHIVGLDLSKEMIDYANRKALNLGLQEKASFLCENIDNICQLAENNYDFVVMSLFLHQFPEEKQLKILSDAKRIGKKIIIADYHFPVPAGFNGFAVRLAEALAGGEHNRSFKAYAKNGGCMVLAEKAQLNLLHTKASSSKVFAVWVFE
jgi:ubiquinone/menaquinone biosynthesis C-methylase UbiE